MQKWAPVLLMISAAALAGVTWIASHPEVHAPWWLSLAFAVVAGGTLTAKTVWIVQQPSAAAVVDQAAQLAKDNKIEIK